MNDGVTDGSRPTTEHLEYAAAALTYVVASLHLFHPKLGVGRLVTIVAADPALLVSHPRPLLFVLTGLALLGGPPAVSSGLPRRLLYALGMVLMAGYVVGYFGWHLSGHGGFLPVREPLYHGLEPHEAVVAHLRGDAWAAAAVVSETFLAIVLAVLYRRAP